MRKESFIIAYFLFKLQVLVCTLCDSTQPEDWDQTESIITLLSSTLWLIEGQRDGPTELLTLQTVHARRAIIPHPVL